MCVGGGGIGGGRVHRAGFEGEGGVGNLRSFPAVQWTSIGEGGPEGSAR